MMDAKDRVVATLPSVTLEEQVPVDHCSRQLERARGVRFARDLVRAACAPTGRPSFDPVACLMLQLVLFLGGLRSQRP